MRWRRQSEREFMREIIGRMELSERELVRAFRDMREESRAAVREMHAEHVEMIAEMRSVRERVDGEHNDLRRALLAILDRLEPGDATA
jgi:hypothetical protein